MRALHPARTHSCHQGVLLLTELSVALAAPVRAEKPDNCSLQHYAVNHCHACCAMLCDVSGGGL